MHDHAVAAGAINMGVERNGVERACQAAPRFLKQWRLCVANPSVVTAVVEERCQVDSVLAEQRATSVVPKATSAYNVHPKLVSPTHLIPPSHRHAWLVHYLDPAPHSLLAGLPGGVWKTASVDERCCRDMACGSVTGVIDPQSVDEALFIHLLRPEQALINRLFGC